MEILDKKGYLRQAIRFLENNLISQKGIKKISRRSGISEELLKELSLKLKNFSEKKLLTVINDKIEESHSSLGGVNAEITGVNLSIELDKKKPFILLGVTCEITANGDVEDKIKFEIKIFSGKEIIS